VKKGLSLGNYDFYDYYDYELLIGTGNVNGMVWDQVIKNSSQQPAVAQFNVSSSSGINPGTNEFLNIRNRNHSLDP
jgi:hypothetical protein